MKVGRALLVFFAGTVLGAWAVWFLGDRSRNASSTRRSMQSIVLQSRSEPSRSEPDRASPVPLALDWLTELTSATNASPAFLLSLRQIPPGQFAAAAELIVRLPSASLRTLGLQVVLERWCSVDPRRAADFATKISDHELRKSSLAAVLQRWILIDRMAPSDWIRSAPAALRPALAESYLQLLAEGSFPEAIAQAELLVKAGLRRDLIHFVLRDWGKKDPATAAAWTANLPARERESLLDDIISHWAEKDPGPATTFLAEEKNQTLWSKLLPTLAAGWAKNDPHSAFMWLTNFPPAQPRADALRRVFLAWADVDPVSAIAASADAGVTPGGGKAAFEIQRMVTTGWARRDPEAALAWATTITDETQRGWFLSDILERYAESQPARAAELVVTMSPGPAQKKAAMEVLQRWSRVDGDAASAWAAQFPDGELKDEAVYTVARHWASKAPDQTAHWLEQIPVGGTKDAGISAFVATMDGSQPDLATRWATQIEDPKLRLNNVESAARRWLTANPAEASAWIQANLDRSLQARILESKQAP